MVGGELIGALVAVFMLINLAGVGVGTGHAASADEQKVIQSLINNGYVTTLDGLTDEDFNLDVNEGAVVLSLETQSDLNAFKALSQEGKKELLNELVQSN